MSDTQETAVAVRDATPLDVSVETFRAGLDRRKANRAALMEWVRSALVDKTDYGRIHFVSKDKCSKGAACDIAAHWSKPCLFKPGAEKICGMLAVTVVYPTLAQYEQAALHGTALESIILRCELRTADGMVVADGVGARSLKQDYGDLNKALKMAEKSAHIDATLRMAGLSEVFTQDLEDMKPTEGGDAPAAPEPARPPLQKCPNCGKNTIARSTYPYRDPATGEEKTPGWYCTDKKCGESVGGKFRRTSLPFDAIDGRPWDKPDATKADADLLAAQNAPLAEQIDPPIPPATRDELVKMISSVILANLALFPEGEKALYRERLRSDTVDQLQATLDEVQRVVALRKAKA